MSFIDIPILTLNYMFFVDFTTIVKLKGTLLLIERLSYRFTGTLLLIARQELCCWLRDYRIDSQELCRWLRDNAIECCHSMRLLSHFQQHCRTFNDECTTIDPFRTFNTTYIPCYHRPSEPLIIIFTIILYCEQYNIILIRVMYRYINKLINSYKLIN